MTKHKEKKEPRSRVKNHSHTYLIVCLVVAALLTVAFYFYIKNTASMSMSEDVAETEQTSDDLPIDQKNPLLTTQSGNLGNKELLSPDAANQSVVNNPELAGILPKDNKLQGNLSLQEDEDPGGSANLSPDANQSMSYEQQLIADINKFYSHLDNQAYMKAYKLKDSSKEHFSSLLQKLLDNPPIVTRETDDLFTLLKNTAHFFRVLGKNNLLMLKGILDREKDSFEKILKSFYSLISHPDYLQKEYGLLIPDDSLYDYAGFFLNTMGGRLYLFRRDSTSRMLVSFYAILVIDRVKNDGNAHHGLDLSKPIDSLIEEIENTGKRLRLKEEYLDTLYDLKEKYSY